MREQDAGFDYQRYRRLLADAVDENKRLALIALLIEERAKDRLAALRASDRASMTATTIARVLGTPALGTAVLGTPVLGTPVLGTPALGISLLGAPRR
jgi:hypothetical protein